MVMARSWHHQQARGLLRKLGFLPYFKWNYRLKKKIFYLKIIPDLQKVAKVKILHRTWLPIVTHILLLLTFYSIPFSICYQSIYTHTSFLNDLGLSFMCHISYILECVFPKNRDAL